MTTTELNARSGFSAVNRTGIYMAVLQLFFTLGWTTYVIYLPKLAAEVGIAPSAVILLLMLDQAIFTLSDTAMGIAADRVAKLVGRLSIFIGLLTAISCTAFVALPFVAGNGPGAQGLFIGVVVIWVITASALRAPPLTLLGKHRAKPMDARPGPHMPPAMHGIGMDGHKAVSEFATAAKAGERDKAMALLPNLTGACVGCHYSYRTR